MFFFFYYYELGTNNSSPYLNYRYLTTYRYGPYSDLRRKFVKINKIKHTRCKFNPMYQQVGTKVLEFQNLEVGSSRFDRASFF